MYSLVCIRSGVWFELIREGDSGTDRDRLCPPARLLPTPSLRGREVRHGGTGLYRDGAALYKTQETAARSLLLSTHKRGSWGYDVIQQMT